MIFHGYDASKPPRQPYPKAAAAFGYIGGDTPHVWTLQEWLDATQGGALRSGPIWTADYRTDAPGPFEQARAAVDAAKALGWTDHARILRYIILDSETSEDIDFIRGFASAALNGGFLTADYRSADAILAKPSGLPEFVARWGEQPGPFSDYQEAFQYKAEVPWLDTQVDLDAFSTEMWERLGRGPRRHVVTA